MDEKILWDEKVGRVGPPSAPGRHWRDFRDFYLHQWLDVKDTEGSWLEAQVTAVEPGRIRIHYKGFAAKYDEWLSTTPGHPDAVRMSPLHTHTPEHRKYGEVKAVQGARMDVLDSSDKWLQGEVLEVDLRREMVLIHYLGWDAKYDEWINWESGRLAPLHTFTRPSATSSSSASSSRHPMAIGAVTPTTGGIGGSYHHQFARHSAEDAIVSGVVHGGSPPDLSAFIPSSAGAASASSAANGSSLPVTLEAVRATEEHERIFRALLLKERGLIIVDQKDDGNCLFRAVSHQVYGDPKWHDLIRARCMDYIEGEKQFFENYIAGDFAAYVARKRRDACWGDHVEIQAMSRIFQRRVEIFSYSTEPLRTSLGLIPEQHPPIRLSYHFKSHYNSVADPDESKHLAQAIQEPPGVMEGRAIERSRAKGGELSSSAAEASDIHATEMDALRVALGLSQVEFNSASCRAYDEIVKRSLQELTERFERETAEAKRQSELSVTEDELVKKLKEESRKEQARKEEEQLRKLLAESEVEEDVKRAMTESLVDESWPVPVQRCVVEGFPLDQVMMAYTIYAGKHPSEDVVARNMANHLRALGITPTPLRPTEQKGFS